MLALVTSLDGLAPIRMVSVSASVNLPLHHKVQKFSSGTGSPGCSRKKGRKTVVCVCDTSCSTTVKRRVIPDLWLLLPFNGRFPGEPGLAGSPLVLPPPSGLDENLLVEWVFCHGLEVLPATQPSMSKQWRDHKALTSAGGLTSSSFLHPQPDCWWKAHCSLYDGYPTPCY